MRVPFEEVQRVLKRVLLSREVPEDVAEQVATEMAINSLEGVYTHGINRFYSLIRGIDRGAINVKGRPVLVQSFAALERYDGELGLGVSNALFCLDRAVELAGQYGIGLVALRNTNHWMRAATYALRACARGMAAICWTNTMPNMPTWGAVDPRLGNNPITLGFPRAQGHVVVDLAMSQFSYGALELAKLDGREMPFPAGYDEHGELTTDPLQVMKTLRILPMGYWKGAALSIVLDVLAAALSEGNSVAALRQKGEGSDFAVSQVFVVIDYAKFVDPKRAAEIADQVVEDVLGSQQAQEGGRIAYPGQRRLEVREENLRLGIPVHERVWRKILSL
jgi:3-dehydro-L-gulonate 2-dehydrogenase